MKYIFACCTLMLVAACGGSYDSPPAGGNNPPPVGGIGRTGIASGPITNFGSVIVNGVRYDTASATFTIDDNPGTESDLEVGDIVTVLGTIDDNLTTGTADSVSFDDDVKGPVQSIDIAAGQLVVLGQTVIVGADTSFDDNISPASLEGLAVGDIVEVSGFFDADGDILATRIEMKPAGTQFEVHGFVNGLDTINFRFSLNALVVDYSAATLDDFPGGQINEDDFVEAKGDNLNAAGELVASKVEFETVGVIGDAGARVEVEGFITRFVSATDFDVAGMAATTDASTVFEGGIAADLGLNIKVEVEGDLNASNVIVAEKVDIRRAKVVRATALIDSVDTNTDTLVMLGITVEVDELTRMEDKSSAGVAPLTIADLNAGEYIGVRGSEMPAGSGQILAALLEREDVDSRTILQGFVTTISTPDFSILGVDIQTNAGTVFRDTDDSVLTAAQFFALLAVNSLVKAEGVEVSDTVIMADEVEFELEL